MTYERVVWHITVRKDAIQPIYEGIDTHATIWAKGRNLRTDLEEKTQTRRQVQHLVLTADFFIDTTAPPHAVRYDQTKDAQPKTALFHPRILGMFPAQTLTLGQFALGEVLSRKDRSIMGANMEVRGGANVLKITSKLAAAGTTVTCWIDPKKGPSIVRIEGGDEEGREELDVNYAQFGERRLWYPSKVLYRSWIRGALVCEEETVTESADFDNVIPDSTFRLQSLELPAGRSVLVNGYRYSKWDGHELVDAPPPLPTSPLPNPIKTNHPQRQSRALYNMSLSLAFGLAALVLLYRYIRYIRRA